MARRKNFAAVIEKKLPLLFFLVESYIVVHNAAVAKLRKKLLLWGEANSAAERESYWWRNLCCARCWKDERCWLLKSSFHCNWSCRHDWGKQSLLLLTLLKQVIVSPRDCKGIAHSGWEEMLVMVEGWRLMLRRLRLSSCCPRWSQLLMKLVTVVACCGCFGRRYHWDCCGGLWWFEGYLWVYFRLERLKSKAVTVLAER